MRQGSKSGVSSSFCHSSLSILHDTVAHSTASGVTCTVSRRTLTSALLNCLLPPTFAVFFPFPNWSFLPFKLWQVCRFCFGISPRLTCRNKGTRWGIWHWELLPGRAALWDEDRVWPRWDSQLHPRRRPWEWRWNTWTNFISICYWAALSFGNYPKKGERGKHINPAKEGLQTKNSLLLISCGCLGTNEYFSKTVSCITDIAQLEQQKETTGTAQAKRMSHYQYLNWEALLISKAGTDSSLSHHNAFLCQGYYL